MHAVQIEDLAPKQSRKKMKRNVLFTVPIMAIAAVFLTVSYFAPPAEINKVTWTKTIKDEAEGVGVQMDTDSTGNVYLASHSIRKFDQSGRQSWEREFEKHQTVSGLAVDTTNDLLYAVTPRTGVDGPAKVGAYTTAGRVQWITPLEDDEAWVGDMAVDPKGGFYIVGGTIGDPYFANPDGRAFILKYDPRGKLVWSKSFRVGDKGPAIATSIAVGADGSLYVSSSGLYGQTSGNSIVSKFTPEGRHVWERAADRYSAIVVDSADNLYGIALSIESGSSVHKHTPRGKRVWSRDLKSGVFVDLTVDASDNLYLISSNPERKSWLSETTLFMYDSQGSLKWKRGVSRGYAHAIAFHAPNHLNIVSWTRTKPTDPQLAEPPLTNDSFEVITKLESSTIWDDLGARFKSGLNDQ